MISTTFLEFGVFWKPQLHTGSTETGAFFYWKNIYSHVFMANLCQHLTFHLAATLHCSVPDSTMNETI